MTDKHIETLKRWRDSYWQTALLAHNNGDERYFNLLLLSQILQNAILLLKDKDLCGFNPQPVFGYEQYKYGEKPE